MKAMVVPIVVGALGNTPRIVKSRLNERQIRGKTGVCYDTKKGAVDFKRLVTT